MKFSKNVYLLKETSFIKNRIIEPAKSFYSKKCEKDDLCPCPEFKPPQKPYKIVQEKSCKPCSFVSWKPKEVILPVPQPKECSKVKENIKKKQCYPGMQSPPKPETICDYRDKAKYCWKHCDPKHVDHKHCPKQNHPKAANYVKKTCIKPKCPNPDWDTDGCK